MRLTAKSLLINILVFVILSNTKGVFADTSRKGAQSKPSSLGNSLIYSVSHAGYITPTQMLNNLNQARMVIIGEYHDEINHHKNQEEIMQSLAKGKTVSVGLEFLNWNQQELFDQYQSSQINEETFLREVKWKNSYPFSFYRPLVNIALSSGGRAYGLNMPRSAVRKVLCEGPDNVNDEVKALMPPNFTKGTQLAFQFFKETIEEVHPLPQDFYDQFYLAQSLWDDTMAHNAITHSNPDDAHAFVVIVGGFHTYHKLGLPDRILKRTNNELDPIVISQISLEKLTTEEAEPYIEKDDNYGDLADYIIFTVEKESTEEEGEPKPLPLDYSILCH